MRDVREPEWLSRLRQLLNDQLSRLLQPLLGKKTSREKQYLSRQTLLLFLLQILFLGAGFVISILLARTLGAEGYGIFTYIFSWIMVLGKFGNLGLATLLIREIAAYRSKNQWSLLKGIIYWSRLIVSATSIVLIGGVCLVVYLLYEPTSSIFRPAYLIAALALPFLALTSINRSVLQGLHLPTTGHLAEKLIRPVVFAVALLIIYIFFYEYFNVFSAILLNLIAFFLMFAGSHWLAQTRLSSAIKTARPAFRSKVWLSSALAFLLISGMRTIETYTDVLMLGSLSTADTVGIFHVAKRLANVMGMFLLIVNMALAPVISDLYSKNNRKRLQKIITKTIRWVFLLSLPGAIILIVGGPWILRIFGATFASGWPALIVLCIGQVFSIALGSVGYLLSMTGHERVTTYGLGAGVVVNIILNFILIPIWQELGAAIATLASIMVWNVLLSYQVQKKVGISSSIIGPIKQASEK